MRHEDYGELALDAKVEMIRSLVPLGLMHVHELLEDEVKGVGGRANLSQGRAGARSPSRKQPGHGRAWRPAGTDPCATGSGASEGGEIPLRCYEAVSHGGEVNDLLLKRVLYGISCRNYEAAAEAIPGAIGLSSSNGVPRVRASERCEAAGECRNGI